MNKRKQRQAANSQRRIDYTRYIYQSVLISLMIILLLFLLGFIVIPVEVASWVPYSVHSILRADYSADDVAVLFPGLRMEVIFDAIQDLGTPVAWQSKATLEAYLQGTIPTATLLIIGQSTATLAPGITLIPTETVQVTGGTTPTGIIPNTPGTSKSPTPTATRFVTATMTPRNNATATAQASAIPTQNYPTATNTVATFTSTPRPATPTAGFPTTQPAPSSTLTTLPTASRTPTSTPTRTPIPTFTQIPSPTITATIRPSPTAQPTPTRTPRPYPEPPTDVPYP